MSSISSHPRRRLWAALIALSLGTIGPAAALEFQVLDGDASLCERPGDVKLSFPDMARGGNVVFDRYPDCMRLDARTRIKTDRDLAVSGGGTVLALTQQVFGRDVSAPPFDNRIEDTSKPSDWPPSDPMEPLATAVFTVEWVSGLRGLSSIRQLQNAAGAKGKMIAFDSRGQAPRAVFTWTGPSDSGRMRAFVYEDGSFGAIVTLAQERTEIALNSFGAFVCPSCAPSVNACGRRPSWVPHDVHWDTFDCPRTLTGPADLSAPDP